MYIVIIINKTEIQKKIYLLIRLSCHTDKIALIYRVAKYGI